MKWEFHSDGVLGLLRGKDFHSIDMMLPLIHWFVNKDNAGREDGQLTKASNLYSVLVVERCARYWSG